MCRSLEHLHQARTGSVHDSASEALEASYRHGEVIKDADMLVIERGVMGLPDKHRLALRLKYVAHRRMPMSQKRRLLGCREDEYEELVFRAALMLANRLNIHTDCDSIQLPSI